MLTNFFVNVIRATFILHIDVITSMIKLISVLKVPRAISGDLLGAFVFIVIKELHFFGSFFVGEKLKQVVYFIVSA